MDVVLTYVSTTKLTGGRMFAQDLKPGMTVVIYDHPVKLETFVSTVEGRDYWWATTLATLQPEIQMYAFSHDVIYRTEDATTNTRQASFAAAPKSLHQR